MSNQNGLQSKNLELKTYLQTKRLINDCLTFHSHSPQTLKTKQILKQPLAHNHLMGIKNLIEISDIFPFETFNKFKSEAVNHLKLNPLKKLKRRLKRRTKGNKAKFKVNGRFFKNALNYCSTGFMEKPFFLGK